MLAGFQQTTISHFMTNHVLGVNTKEDFIRMPYSVLWS
jgi:hypothetical protein